MEPNIAHLLNSDLNPFTELLSRLCSTESTQRTEAETLFSTLKTSHPENLITKLLQLLKTGPSSEARCLSSTLLRQVLTKEHPTVWPNIPKELQESVKTELLAFLTHETDPQVAQKVADLVAELFSKIIGEEYWPELMPYVLNGIEQTNSVHLRLSSVHMLSEAAPVLVDSMENSVERFICMMRTCLRDENSSIKLETFKALQSFALSLQDAGDVKKLKVLMNDVMDAFQTFQTKSVDSTEAHAVLIELAGYVPTLFEDILEKCLSEFLSTAHGPHHDVDVKTMALEFLLTLIEGISEAKMEPLKSFIQDFITIVMDCLLQIEDTHDWYNRTGGLQESADFGDIHDLGVASVDRLASSISASMFLTLFSPYLEQWGQDSDWKKRHGILTVIGQMAEGCTEEIQQSVIPLLEICSAGLTDTNLRVRWAACQALGLVADEIGNLFQRSHRDEIIKRLMLAAVVDDPGAASVQKHALRCLLNIINSTDHPINGMILDEIVKWILQSMQFMHEGVSKAALDCLACLSNFTENGQFAKYYDESMKNAFGLLDRYKDPGHVVEMSEIIEVMTMVGVAAGKEAVAQDVQFFIDFLQQLALESQKMDDADDKMNVLINVLNAFGRICSIMKTDFTSLELVKPILLEALATEPKLEKLSPDEMDEMEDEDLPLVIGGMAFSFDRMSLAFLTCGMKNAMTIAESLDHKFFSLLVPVLERFLTAMDYNLNKDVRDMGIQGQPVFLNCAVSMLHVENNENIRNFISTLLSKQWEALLGKMGDFTEESQKSSAPSVLEACGKIIEILQGNVDPTTLHSVFSKVERILSQIQSWKQEQQAKESGSQLGETLEELGGLDDEEYDEDIIEVESLCSIQSLFASILKTTGDQYYEWIEAFIPSFQKLLLMLTNEEAEDVDSTILETILTVMTDICEFSNKGREKHASEICQLFLQKLDHKASKIKHTSAFGLGMMAQKVPQILKPMIGAILTQLTKQVEQLSFQSQDLDVAMAKDNVISAIWKILSTNAERCTPDDIFHLYHICLVHLPIANDLDEAFVVHESFLNFVENQDLRVLGHQRQHLVKCVGILMEILASDVSLASPEILKRMSTLLKTLESDTGCHTVAIQKLQEWSPEKQQQFNTHMTAN